jgi:hypothetical protein
MSQQNDVIANLAAGSDTTLWQAPASPNGCGKFMVAVPSGSSYGALVRIPGIHAANEYVNVPPGQQVVFQCFERAITVVYAQGGYNAAGAAAGTATGVSFGPVGMMRAYN